MELQEIEQRVEKALLSFNAEEERYDYRETHFNRTSWLELQEACLWLSESKCEEADVKQFIKDYRNYCEISFVDFHIKLAEPALREFNRMTLLFGCKPGERLIPPRGIEDRLAYLRQKTLDAMRLTMENKQIVTEKLRQQFTHLMLRTKDKTPEILATALNYENYNPYQKRLSPAPGVNMQFHLTEQTKQETKPLEEPTAFVPEVSDNAAFESRLAPAPVRPQRNLARERAITGYPAFKPETPHELPAEIHKEFAAYCAELYEKTKGH